MLTTFTQDGNNFTLKGFEGSTEIGRIEGTITTGVLSIDHTRVPKEHEGKGYAAGLTKAVADYVEQNPGLKIKPVCSYAVAFFARHPEFSTLLIKE